MKKLTLAILFVALLILPIFAFVGAAEMPANDENIAPIVVTSGNSGNTGSPMSGNGTLNMSQDKDQLRQQIRDCIQNQDATCEAVRQMGRDMASNMVGSFCANTEQRMETLRTRTENAVGLTDEEKEIFMNTIRTQEEKMQQTCSEFEKGNKDSAAIKKAAGELKQYAAETSLKTALAKEQIKERRVGLVLEKAGQLEEKLNKFQLRLNQTNNNCSGEMEQLRQQFKTQIGEGKQAYGESSQMRQRIMSGEHQSGNFNEDLKQSQQLMQQSQTKLQEAQKTLQQITTRLRECNLNLEETQE